MNIPERTIKLYKGKVIVDFYSTYNGKPSHKYVVKVLNKKGEWETKNPVSVTGGTSVIDKSAPLMYWAANLGRDFMLSVLKKGTPITEELIIEASKQHQIKKEKAASIGNQVHEWAENHIKGLKPAMPDDPKALNGITAFLKFIDEHEIKFIEVEKPIYSLKYNYVGLMDCKFTAGIGLRGEKEKHKIIHPGDYKTSNGFYDEYRFQVAAYQEADFEECGQKYGDKWIIRFGKEDADFEARDFKEHDKDFKAFLNALELRSRLNELKRAAYALKKLKGGK